jgi:dolichol kinase
MGVYFAYDKIYYLYNRNRQIKTGVVPGVILIFVCGFIFLFLNYNNIMLAVLTICGLYSALIGDIKKFYEKTKKMVFGNEDDEDDYDDDL